MFHCCHIRPLHHTAPAYPLPSSPPPPPPPPPPTDLQQLHGLDLLLHHFMWHPFPHPKQMCSQIQALKSVKMRDLLPLLWWYLEALPPTGPLPGPGNQRHRNSCNMVHSLYHLHSTVAVAHLDPVRDMLLVTAGAQKQSYT